MVDDCCELDDAVAAEDGVEWISNVYHVEGYELRPLAVTFAEGHVQFDFFKGLNFLPSEANEGVLRFVQVLLCEPYLDEALPSENICGAAVVNKDPTYVVSSEVYRVSADICTDGKGVVAWVVLKPAVSFEESDWDVRPGSAEMFAFADM